MRWKMGVKKMQSRGLEDHTGGVSQSGLSGGGSCDVLGKGCPAEAPRQEQAGCVRCCRCEQSREPGERGCGAGARPPVRPRRP